MATSSALTVTAVYEDGVLRPDQPLPLSPRQRVRLVVEIPELGDEWPDNVAEIYQQITEDDRRLAAAMWV